MDIFDLRIIDGPAPWVVYGLAIAIVLVLLIRKPTVRWVLTAGIGILSGAALATIVFLVSDATNAFGDRLPPDALWWAIATFAAVGLAIVSLWNNPVWRKVVAIIGIPVFVVAGTIGVNAVFGINPTLGSLFGIVSADPIVIPTPTATATDGPPDKPLYDTWKPPADMPAQGQQGTQVIPATASGFNARPAGIYLPPAALVKNAPELPVILFMMGYPGNPDPSYIGAVLDEYAAKNNGLAPIAVVADQIGTGGDPACADSAAYGNAETYITKDVVTWITANLHVIDDPAWWVIGGYSNGGGCAIKYGAKYPDLWHNIIDVSGEPFPGSEDPDSVIQQIYGGDKAAFEAAKPLSIMAAHGPYTGFTAAFSAGAEDPTYMQAAQTVSDAAKAAGMTVTYETVPGAGHVQGAVQGGMEIGVGVMYPVLGLSPG